MALHIIEHCYGWREEDYDGYNDYYVNPEYLYKESTRKKIENQQDKETKEEL